MHYLERRDQMSWLQQRRPSPSLQRQHTPHRHLAHHHLCPHSCDTDRDAVLHNDVLLLLHYILLHDIHHDRDADVLECLQDYYSLCPCDRLVRCHGTVADDVQFRSGSCAGERGCGEADGGDDTRDWAFWSCKYAGGGATAESFGCFVRWIYCY
jgi:hypothetical protein